MGHRRKPTLRCLKSLEPLTLKSLSRKVLLSVSLRLQCLQYPLHSLHGYQRVHWILSTQVRNHHRNAAPTAGEHSAQQKSSTTFGARCRQLTQSPVKEVENCSSTMRSKDGLGYRSQGHLWMVSILHRSHRSQRKMLFTTVHSSR